MAIKNIKGGISLIQNLIQASGEEHDCEVVAYGMDAIGSGLVTFAVLMLSGWASHHLPETLVYIVCHFLAARAMGGYHAHTRLGCLALTVSICFLGIWVSDMIWVWIPVWGIAVSYILCLFCVFRFAPAEHPDKELDEDTRRKNRNRSLFYMTVAGFVVMIFWNINRRTACVFWVNMTEIVISMIIGKEVYGHGEGKSRKTTG